MGKFKLGDEVVVTAFNYEIKDPEISEEVETELYGNIGTICHDCIVSGVEVYGVNFGRDINGHTCFGTCPDGYGQKINAKYLKRLNELDRFELKKNNVTEEKGNKTMQKKKYEKKPLEQQIKEKYESKRNVLNIRIGFTSKYEQTLVPKKVYYDSTTSTIVIDFGNVVGKIKAKPNAGDKYDPSIAFNIITAKAIYKRFDFPFESDMSSLEAKITAKYLLHKNTGIAFEKYVKYLKNMVQTFLREDAELEKAEQIRKNQKAKNRIRKERQKQRRQNKK